MRNEGIVGFERQLFLKSQRRDGRTGPLEFTLRTVESRGLREIRKVFIIIHLKKLGDGPTRRWEGQAVKELQFARGTFVRAAYGLILGHEGNF